MVIKFWLLWYFIIMNMVIYKIVANSDCVCAVTSAKKQHIMLIHLYQCRTFGCTGHLTTA